jgi:hypothetical protein
MFRHASRAPRPLPLGSLALLLSVATPALAQNALGQAGTVLDSSSLQQLFDRASMSGTGTGTWIEAGAASGAAFAELLDQDGIPRFLLEAQSFALTSGPGEYWPHGVLDGDLLPYELYIVPTEVQPVGAVLGEWFMTGANRGFLRAVIYAVDAKGDPAAAMGSLHGTFELPPILIDPDLPPPAAASAGVFGAGASALGSGTQVNPHIQAIPPYPAGPRTEGVLLGQGRAADGMQELQQGQASAGSFPVGAFSVGASGASALGSGTQVNPHMQYIPPYPVGPLDEGVLLGQGQAADGLQELQQGQASVGSAPLGASGPAGHGVVLGGGQIVNPDLHAVPPYPAGPGEAAVLLGSGTEASGMELLRDAGPAFSGSEGEGEVEGNPRVGDLHLYWMVFG